MADPGPAPKPPVRSCVSCPKRLPALYYDKHTVCDKCRGKVCTLTSFCDECRDWPSDFRQVYVQHYRSLRQKRVSKVKKGKKKPKSSPKAEDSQSNVSGESEGSIIVHSDPPLPQNYNPSRLIRRKKNPLLLML